MTCTWQVKYLTVKEVSYITIPSILIPEIKGNTGILALVPAWELDGVLRNFISNTGDLDVEAMSRELRTPSPNRLGGNGISTKCENLSSEDVSARLNITRQFNRIGSLLLD
jgi:hypothetical protein